MCFIHTMGYYLAMKSSKVLILPIMWMNFYNIMLSERSQTQKVMYCMISFIWIAQNRQIHGDRKQIRGYQGWGVGKMRNDCLKTTGFLLGWLKLGAIRWPEKSRRLIAREVWVGAQPFSPPAGQPWTRYLTSGLKEHLHLEVKILYLPISWGNVRGTYESKMWKFIEKYCLFT